MVVVVVVPVARARARARPDNVVTFDEFLEATFVSIALQAAVAELKQ